MMEPRGNATLIGHAEAAAAMEASVQAGRVHHAWLITGPEGIGKATLAYRFARHLLAPPGTDPDAPDAPVFRRIAAATHADVLTVERAWDDKRKRLRAEIVVDDVRAVADFLRLTPAEGGWRVVVVDGAEHLNRNAANALLKVLEEPPPRAVLLLACAAPGRLLPTIRSRCRHLRLQPLTPVETDEVLALALPDAPESDRAGLAALAAGSPGRAVALAEEGGLAAAGLVAGVLREVPGLSVPRIYELADKLARTEGAYATFMDLLRAAIDAAVREAARGQGDPAQRRLIATRPLAEWGDLWQSLTRLQDETERFNLDKRHAIVSGLDLLNAPPLNTPTGMR